MLIWCLDSIVSIFFYIFQFTFLWKESTSTSSTRSSFSSVCFPLFRNILYFYLTSSFLWEFYGKSLWNMLIAVEFWTESDVTEYYSHLLYSAHSLFHLNTQFKSRGVGTFDICSHGLGRVPLRVDGDEDGRQIRKRLYFIWRTRKQGNWNKLVKTSQSRRFAATSLSLPISSTTSIIFSSSSGQMSGQWVKPK